MTSTLITWENKFSLGLDEIDDQHQSLVEVINKIWHAIIAKSDMKIILALIEELERYTLAHFTAEETFMRVMNYPEFDSHKREHKVFIARIAAEKQHALQTGTLSLELVHFLRDWLIEHILASDKHYAEFMRKAEQQSRSLLGKLFSRLF